MNILNRVNLGFDISTSIIGISLFKDTEFYKLYFIDLTKTKDYFEKAKKVKHFIYNLIVQERLEVQNVFIEDILQSFSRGMSSAKTIIQLARFNGIVSNIIYELSGCTPVYLNVNSARKILGIKIDKNSNKDKKEQVMDWVDQDLDEKYDWPTKIVSRGKNKGDVKFEKYCYDMADAYVICKAGIKNVIQDT